MKLTHSIISAISAALFMMAGATHAQVQIEGAWVRATVKGQKGTGAFMKITSRQDARLVSVSSPVAGVSEIHEMKMEGDVMKMRALTDGLELPAGKAVELKPGGYHLMLMDLKDALPRDSTVPLTLVFRDAKGAQSRMEIKLPVQSRAPAAASGAASATDAGHGGHGGHGSHGSHGSHKH